MSPEWMFWYVIGTFLSCILVANGANGSFTLKKSSALCFDLKTISVDFALYNFFKKNFHSSN